MTTLSNEALLAKVRSHWRGDSPWSADVLDLCDRLEAASAPMWNLRELLAVIHRDGGQYLDEHGMEKAFADAVELSSARIVDAEQSAPMLSEGVVERVARAICEANSDTWRVGTYEAATGPNFEMEDHPLDPFNNHWRRTARAALPTALDNGGGE